MARTVEELVRRPTLARSFTAGYRPPASGPDALVEGEPLVVFPDKVLLVGVGGGLFVVFDLSGNGGGHEPSIDRYTHVQDAASDTWFVNHNLGRLPVVAVLSEAGAQVLAAVEHVSPNQARIALDSPMRGQAVCV